MHRWKYRKMDTDVECILDRTLYLFDLYKVYDAITNRGGCFYAGDLYLFSDVERFLTDLEA